MSAIDSPRGMASRYKGPMRWTGRPGNQFGNATRSRSSTCSIARRGTGSSQKIPARDRGLPACWAERSPPVAPCCLATVSLMPRGSFEGTESEVSNRFDDGEARAMTTLRDLYPEIEPYASGRFGVDEIHSL